MADYYTPAFSARTDDSGNQNSETRPTQLRHWATRIAPISFSLKNAPKTSKKKIVYFFNFDHGEYEIWNPDLYSFQVGFPIVRLKKVPC